MKKSKWKPVEFVFLIVPKLQAFNFRKKKYIVLGSHRNKTKPINTEENIAKQTVCVKSSQGSGHEPRQI